MATTSSTPFQAGQQVVCKPGVFGFVAGEGEVKDVFRGMVIVYFKHLHRATVFVTVRVLRLFTSDEADVCMVGTARPVWRVGVEELRVCLVREAE